ncbi:uncharacterized protein LOC127456499 [Myxocyprinus asiaticus]|uniref:uncharacterized protein LOC127456499 n=1 Tax=Myxocyprinus asiaticus TaxID=70543 RepID=UPI002221636D|nr:uncharacterized protein LOC127456499 [Myxocyprinus asiaticus]
MKKSCGSEVYDHNNKFLKCCSGHLNNISHLDRKTECCGIRLLKDKTKNICCSSASHAMLYETKDNHACCGQYYYNKSLWSCCAEHLKPTPSKTSTGQNVLPGKTDNSSPLYRLKPLLELIPDICNKTVLFGKVESVALYNNVRHIVLGVFMTANKVIKKRILNVPLDHCSSPALENGMTYLWEENAPTKDLKEMSTTSLSPSLLSQILTFTWYLLFVKKKSHGGLNAKCCLNRLLDQVCDLLYE